MQQKLPGGWHFPWSLNIFPFWWRANPNSWCFNLSFCYQFSKENLSRLFWFVETSCSQHFVPGQRLAFLPIWTCLAHIPAATNSSISLLSSGLFPSVPFQGQTDLESLCRRDNSDRRSCQGAAPTPSFAQNFLCVLNRDLGANLTGTPPLHT